MITIICFFVGLILVVSSGEISLLTNISYFSLVCNIAGCSLMGYSTFVFWTRRNNEIQCRNSILEGINKLSERIPGNVEYEHGIELIKTLCDRQKQCKDSVEELCGALKNFTDYYKKNSPSNEGLQSNVDAFIIELLDIKKTIGESNNTISKTIKTQSNELKTLEFIIDSHGKNELESIKSLQSQMETLQRETHEDSVLCNESLGKIELSIRHSCEEEAEKLENVLEIIDGMLHIPKEVSEQIERLIVVANNYTTNLTTKIEYLSEDLEEQDGKRMNNFNRMLDELRDYCEGNNEEIVEQIKVLSQQYLQFEKTVDVIVQKMTTMAESDIEVMKGFLNG